MLFFYVFLIRCVLFAPIKKDGMIRKLWIEKEKIEAQFGMVLQDALAIIMNNKQIIIRLVN